MQLCGLDFPLWGSPTSSVSFANRHFVISPAPYLLDRLRDQYKPMSSCTRPAYLLPPSVIALPSSRNRATMPPSIRSLMGRNRCDNSKLESLPLPRLGIRSTSLETTTSTSRRRYPSSSEGVAPSNPSLRRTRGFSSGGSSDSPDYGNSTDAVSATAPRIPFIHRFSEGGHPGLVSGLDGVQEQHPGDPARASFPGSNSEGVDDIDQLIAELEAAGGGENPVGATEERGEGTGVPNPIPDHWLNTDTERGLLTTQADRRRKTCGFNELKIEKEKNLFVQFFLFFRGPIQFVMMVSSFCRLPVHLVSKLFKSSVHAQS